MISINDIDGIVILEVLETKECQHVEELMKSDYIQLSWNSADNSALPAGAYIEYNDEHYRLLEEYRPTQKDETEYIYSPQFQSITMYWGKLPFFLYSELSEGKITREPDWQLTDNPANFMACVVEAILNETGETWTYAVATELKASAFISFDNVDILSGLNAISSAFETEWRADKVNRVLYLGKAIHNTENPIPLEVGQNVGVPSVTNNKEGDYTRFYIFGSTRNIEQSYEGSSTQSIVNKRLTLDPAVYHGGYIDTKGHYDGNGVFVSELQQGEIFTKTLFFDDVYPRATQGTVESKGLPISDVKARLKWRFDDNGQKVQVGIDESGNAVYDQYAVWYFKIAGLSFNKDMIIANKNLTCSFESGSLQGYEFELKYHEESETITETPDGVPFIIDAGDYEILFKEENGLIIPSLTGLIPANGNEVALFNIILPEEYIATAYKELETTALTEIKRRKEDLNNYSFSSNPIAFKENNPNLSIGQAVTYINGSYSYSTRVIKLITQIDFPCEQYITIGNEKIQGDITKLKEEVVSANTNINVLAILNEQTQSLQESYKRTQEAIIDGFARIKDMWQFYDDDTIISKYNVASQKAVSAGGVSTDNGSGSGGLNVTQMWEALAAKATGTNQIIDDSHISTNIARKTDLNNYLTKEDLMWKNITDL